MTMSLLRGKARLMFFKLCARAPDTEILPSCDDCSALLVRGLPSCGDCSALCVRGLPSCGDCSALCVRGLPYLKISFFCFMRSYYTLILTKKKGQGVGYFRWIFSMLTEI